MSDSLINKGDVAQTRRDQASTAAPICPPRPWLQLMLVCCLFALWGMAGNLNDILIAQFKKASICRIPKPHWCSRSSSSSCTVMALPAAAVIKRYSYKVAILIGLCLYALGCSCLSRQQIMTYGLPGLRGDRHRAVVPGNLRHHLPSLLGPLKPPPSASTSQIFNSLGIIFWRIDRPAAGVRQNDPSHAELLQMPPAAAEAARTQMVSQVVTPLSDHRQRADRAGADLRGGEIPACKTQRSHQERASR